MNNASNRLVQARATATSSSSAATASKIAANAFGSRVARNAAKCCSRVGATMR